MKYGLGPLKFTVGDEDHTTIGTTPQDNTLIPTLSDSLDHLGNALKPKFVAVVHNGALLGHLVHIAFGQAAATAVTLTSGFPVPAHEVCIFDVTGYTHYAIVGGLAGVDFTIVPLGNY